jgi:hypothetical protein|tara:strand:- start:1207 stop:1383 length:177 start_codon:yes stop_codon:yes gene_type:complete
MKKLIKLIFTWAKTNQEAHEDYLAKSEDHADLEFRMKHLDSLSINGNRYSSLYKRFYS